MSLFSLRLRRTHLDNVFHITSRYCKPMCSFSCRRPRSQEQSRNLINEDGCFRQGWTGGTQKSQTLFLKMTFDPEYIRSIALDQHMSSSAADTSSTTTLDTELSKDILDSWRYQSPSHMATLIRNPDPISFHPNPAPHRSKVAEHKSSNPTGEDDIKHRWIGTFFNGGILGGIDASYSSDVNGSNGSIRPSDTIKIMTELYAYAKGYQQQTPTLIDAGIAESRASCYWVALVHKMEGSKDPIEICGFERPIYEQNLKLIHKAATLHLEKHLQCSVSMNVVWKDCRNIQSLQSEFRILDTRSGVLYAFWTAWTVPSKMRLLALVAESKSIKAMALFFSRKDERSPEGDSLDQYFVLKVLNSSDSDGVNGIYSTAGRLAGSFKGLKLPTASYSGDKNPRCQQRLPETLVFFLLKSQVTQLHYPAQNACGVTPLSEMNAGMVGVSSVWSVTTNLVISCCAAKLTIVHVHIACIVLRKQRHERIFFFC